MTVVLLIILLLVTIAMVGVILMQRSEGGALGIGGGGPGNMMSGASAESILTRATMILGIVFMGTCIVLAIISGASDRDASLAEELAGDGESNLPLTFDEPVSDPAEIPDGTVPGDEPAVDDDPEVPGR